jgi:4-hydroxybenzoate polyprenyltransferase
VAAFGVGALLMRGAGCTVNDLWDRDIDQRVARTKSRPLARGAVSTKRAVAWLGVQLGVSSLVLFSLQPAAVVLGAASLGLVGVYPAMKRVTRWPQLVLGLTFNWGALLGWVAVHNELESGLAVVLPLYAGGVAWTLVYDTIYAHQDKKDDALLGLGSTALTLGDGDQARVVLGGFSALTVAGLVASGSAAGVGWVYYPMVGAGAAQLGWQLATVDFENGQDCMGKFVSNQVRCAVLCSRFCVQFPRDIVRRCIDS